MASRRPHRIKFKMFPCASPEPSVSFLLVSPGMLSLSFGPVGLASAPQLSGPSHALACRFTTPSPWHFSPGRWPRQPLLIIQIADLTCPRKLLLSLLLPAPRAAYSSPGYICHHIYICQNFLTACNPKGAGTQWAHSSLSRFQNMAGGFQ